MTRKLALTVSVAVFATLTAGLGACAGSDPPPSPFACTLQVRGAVNEDLWCIAAAYDYSQLDAGFPDGGLSDWAFDLAAYRGTPTAPEIAGGAGLFLSGPPVLGQAYGFTTVTSTVQAGGAERDEGWNPSAFNPVTTHEAHAPLAPGDVGVGSLTVRFTRIPGLAELPIAVNGTLDGTLEPVPDGGYTAPVTIHAEF